MVKKTPPKNGASSVQTRIHTVLLTVNNYMRNNFIGKKRVGVGTETFTTVVNKSPYIVITLCCL